MICYAYDVSSFSFHPLNHQKAFSFYVPAASLIDPNPIAHFDLEMAACIQTKISYDILHYFCSPKITLTPARTNFIANSSSKN
jgi:hypothetical protein